MDTHGMVPHMCLLPHSMDVLETSTSKALLPCAHCSPRAQKPGDAEALLGNTLTQKPGRRQAGWGMGVGQWLLLQEWGWEGYHQPL